jgi:hypothetical protein
MDDYLQQVVVKAIGGQAFEPSKIVLLFELIRKTAVIKLNKIEQN